MRNNKIFCFSVTEKGKKFIINIEFQRLIWFNLSSPIQPSPPTIFFFPFTCRLRQLKHRIPSAASLVARVSCFLFVEAETQPSHPLFVIRLQLLHLKPLCHSHFEFDQSPVEATNRSWFFFHVRTSFVKCIQRFSSRS